MRVTYLSEQSENLETLPSGKAIMCACRLIIGSRRPRLSDDNCSFLDYYDFSSLDNPVAIAV